jgi:hypothetical protein
MAGRRRRCSRRRAADARSPLAEAVAYCCSTGRHASIHLRSQPDGMVANKGPCSATWDGLRSGGW